MFLRPSTLIAGLLTCAFLGGATAVVAQTPTHIYDLNGNYSDTLGGVALTGNGGTFDAANSLLVFGANQGPTLTGGINASTYSIEMYVRLDATSGYRKLIDFKNLSSDNGLYDLDGTLDYYNIAAGTNTSAFTPTAFSDVFLTRDNATQLVVGYVNGVPQFSFTDTTADATFTATNQVVNFLQDDNATGQREASGGAADFIRTYGTALTPAQVAARYSVVSGAAAPEPGSIALLALSGLPAVGMIARRRRENL